MAAGDDHDRETAASLALSIAAGDKASEDEFVRTYYARVLSLVSVRMKGADNVHDVVQEVMIAALRGMRKGALHDPAKLAQYLHGIAVNLTNAQFRRQSREPEMHELREEFLTVDTIARQEEEEKRDLVRNEMGRLDALDRKILWLTMLDGLEPSEIATSIGMKADAVRQRKSRAIKKLMDRLSVLSRRAGPGPRTE